MEMTKAILALVAAIFGVITAIILLRKAYIEKNSVSSNKKKGGGMLENNKKGLIKNKGDNNIQKTELNDITVNGEVKIFQGEKSNYEILNDDYGLLLKEQYVSLFAENGEVHSEKIKVKNVGNGKIEGSVYLDDNCTYKLTGTYRNKVLTGEYTSIGSYTDERGTINLKLISESILSGFCSFSKTSISVADQIRTSPYIWIDVESEDIINGTYAFCTECHNLGRKCCCASEEIDMPILLQNEARKLQSIDSQNKKMHNFSRAIGNTTIRQMNASGNSANPIFCHFYDSSKNKCKIYDIRPTDCRLFPFDIKLDHRTNEYYVGYYNDLCENLPDEETMKRYAHILRPYLFLLFPYANTINQDDVCVRLNNASFEKLYNLHDFIF